MARPRAPRADHDLGPGIHTGRPVQLFTLDIDSENAEHGNRYEPTPYGVLDDLLSYVDDLDFTKSVFVDLGSGKGRIICLAAAHPFKRVVGVEFAPRLHHIAEQNLASLPAARKKAREVRSVCTDAATFAFPRAPLVVFMFNPFTASVLTRVIANLERSHAESPREMWILYYMPLHETVLERSALLSPVTIQNDRVVYRARG